MTGVKKIMLLCAMTFVMHGCAMAPGMSASSTEEATVEPGVTVQVQPITMDLLDRVDAERLSKAGYATAHIGKWHLSYVARDNKEIAEALGLGRSTVTKALDRLYLQRGIPRPDGRRERHQ